MLQDADCLYRYLFDSKAIRGETVVLQKTLTEIIQPHNYPACIEKLLAELLVVTTLLTATIKIEGDITLQIQGDGPLRLLLVQGNHQQQLRGLAKFSGDILSNAELHDLVGNGYLVITITPTQGQRYQGIVDLSGTTIAAIVENYFQQSEQLATKLFIHHGLLNGKPIIAGQLLQLLPTNKDINELTHLAHLAATVTAQELAEIPIKQLLYRLYHQEQLRLFAPQPISAVCKCSEQHYLTILQTLETEALKNLQEKSEGIEIICDYCHKKYHIHQNKLTELIDKLNHP